MPPDMWARLDAVPGTLGPNEKRLRRLTDETVSSLL